MRKRINIAYWGFSHVSQKTLEILIESKGYYPKLLIVKQKDVLKANEFAEKYKNKFKVIASTAPNLKELFSENKINLSLVVSFGEILNEETINIPKHGTINIHYSLLPKYRGASPIESAIINGERETGVSIQKMELKLDSGPILISKSKKIKANESTGSIENKLIPIGVDLFLKTTKDITRNKIKEQIQNEKYISISKKIEPKDMVLDLNDKNIYKKYLALKRRNKLSFRYGDLLVKITKARFTDNKFVIEKVIVPGKRETLFADFKRNYKIC